MERRDQLAYLCLYHVINNQNDLFQKARKALQELEKNDAKKETQQ